MFARLAVASALVVTIGCATLGEVPRTPAEIARVAADAAIKADKAALLACLSYEQSVALGQSRVEATDAACARLVESREPIE